MNLRNNIRFDLRYYADIVYDNFMIFGWAFLLLILMLMGVTRHYAPFDQDEFEAVHTAWKIMQGAEIYRDFFQHHHPFLYYLLIPIIKFFGENLTALMAARFLIFVHYVLIGIVTYYLARRIFGQESALLSVYLLLFAPMFMKILEIRPDGPQTLWAMIALLCLFRFFDTKTIVDLILSGLTLSISFLFLQKICFLVFFMFCILAYMLYNQEINLKHCMIFSVIAGIPVVFYLGYLILTGTFDYYIKFNWLLNMIHPARFYPFHSLPLLFTSQLLTVFYVLGVIYYSITSHQKKIAFLSGGLLFAAVVVVKFSYAQYYAPALPLMAMIAGNAVYSVFSGDRLKMSIIVFALAINPFMGYSFALAKALIKGVNTDQHKKISYVLNMTNPEDYVYDGKSFFNVFRQDVDFFWFEARMHHEKSDLIPIYESLTGQTYDLYRAIDHYKPKIISTYYLDINHPCIVDHYMPSPEYDDLMIRKM